MTFDFIRRFKEVFRHTEHRSVGTPVEYGKQHDRMIVDDDREASSLRDYEFYYWSSVPAPWY